MFRYLAFAWQAEASPSASKARELLERARAQSTRWRTAVERSGLVVLFSPNTAHPEPQVFPGSRGVLFGSLFRRPQLTSDEEECGCAVLAPQEANRIVASGGHALVEDYWGDYVAFLVNEPAGSLRVLRGPASALPCLHTEVQGVHLYFSWMESCAQLEARKFSIDWSHVARTLMGSLTPGPTSVRDVNEIPPGACEQLDGIHRRQHVLWDPITLAKEPAIEDPHEAAIVLRRATRACVHAWASQYPCIVHGLSGGLDSSVTLACLATAPTKPRVICLTQYSEDAVGDERYYARLAAAHAGCELVEWRRDANIDLRTASSTVRSETSPGLRIPAIERIEPDFARDAGAGAIFHGHGGDELFCRNQFGLYVADFLRKRGPRRGLLGLAMHAAVTDGVTTWEILARAAWNAYVPRRWNFAAYAAQDLEGATFLLPDVIAQLRDDRAALAHAPTTRDAPPGKLWQISLIGARRAFHHAFSYEADPVSVSPLLSQPLIEVCLRIPTWFQMAGRRDRALARAAFANELPAAVESRRDKGGAEPLAAEIVERNLGFLREMILDGIVVHQGILDRRRVDEALSEAPASDGVTSVPVFDLLGAEIWARGWEARPGTVEPEAHARAAITP